MENTIENKAKFLVQYWGQNVLVAGGYKNTPTYFTVNADTMHTIDSDYLELTSISQISDQDAIEVAKLQAPTFDNKSKVLRLDNSIEIHRLNNVVKITHEISTFHRGILLMVGGAVQTMYAYDSLVFTDYLRSNGYALPWMGLSVIEQINRGWVKIRS